MRRSFESELSNIFALWDSNERILASNIMINITIEGGTVECFKWTTAIQTGTIGPNAAQSRWIVWKLTIFEGRNWFSEYHQTIENRMVSPHESNHWLWPWKKQSKSCFTWAEAQLLSCPSFPWRLRPSNQFISPNNWLFDAIFLELSFCLNPALCSADCASGHWLQFSFHDFFGCLDSKPSAEMCVIYFFKLQSNEMRKFFMHPNFYQLTGIYGWELSAKICFLSYFQKVLSNKIRK